jgi:TRAP-type mannitol/chloroaromatic compound transport system substrate-binding protein
LPSVETQRATAEEGIAMKTELEERSDSKTARRREVLKTAAAGLGAGVLLACSKFRRAPEAMIVASNKVFKWRAQCMYPVKTPSYEPFLKFCERVSELAEGQLTIEPHSTGDIVPTLQMFDSVETGKLDLAVTSPGYAADKIPGVAFLASYPLGLDRPDQWETWYYNLGGLELARQMHAPHGIHYLGPVQHDLNLIHSRAPIRSFEDFKGKKIRLPGGLIADVFNAMGAKTVFVAGDEVYPALQSGAIDAADFNGPAANYAMGFANVAKYIILGPRSTPCIHQPVDLHAVLVNMVQWNALPKHLQEVLEYAARRYSWDHYAFVQRQNTLVWDNYRAKGVEILHLSTADVDKFRRVAIPLWFKWAKKDPLGRAAFASQLEYMKNPTVAYLTDEMIVDAKGERLAL